MFRCWSRDRFEQTIDKSRRFAESVCEAAAAMAFRNHTSGGTGQPEVISWHPLSQVESQKALLAEGRARRLILETRPEGETKRRARPTAARRRKTLLSIGIYKNTGGGVHLGVLS